MPTAIRQVALALGLAATAAACRASEPIPADVQPVVDLIRALPTAVVTAERVELVRPVRSLDVAGYVRPAIYMHPAASVEFGPFDLAQHAVFIAGIGIQSEAFDKAGDGVEFRVLARTGEDSQELFRQYIDPKRNPADRRWHDVSVPLYQFAGRRLWLTLATTPGPANDYANDWAGWGVPRVLLGTW